MSASIHNLPNIELTQLQRLLDESETERTRINRRIRHIRSAMKSLEAGEAIEDIESLIASIPAALPISGAVRLPEPVAAPVAPAPVDAHPFAGHLGVGLPAGVQAPVPVPPPGAELQMPSVDVGRLGRMSPEELDRLPFGVVTLDASGRVIGYNDTESRLAGLPRDNVIGRNFFGDVAPCAAVQEFEGRFRDFAAGKSRLALETFEFVFNFRKGAQRVVIMISPARVRGRFHVSMIRR